ncbi:MAG TPA: TetR/AcrR family transcriptional regulator [Candidatus Acidoferrum sp.]|nr:TetR/AcrR family transcriptional regulator [Candidatus Acidoferrum sp.]
MAIPLTDRQKPVAPSRPRQRRTPAAQREALLEAAAAVFLERGYAGASIDAVVERAGGSKATVYALFGNKEGLLSALIAQGAETLAASVDALPAGASFEDNLRAIGRSYLNVILQPKRIALYRLVAGESGRCPHLGDIFYRTGPQAVTTRVAEFFRAAVARGQIETDDPEQLAHFFVHALRGDHHNRVLFNPTRMPTPQEIDRHIDFVVHTLLRCCRPTGDKPA